MADEGKPSTTPLDPNNYRETLDIPPYVPGLSPEKCLPETLKAGEDHLYALEGRLNYRLGIVRLHKINPEGPEIIGFARILEQTHRESQGRMETILKYRMAQESEE